MTRDTACFPVTPQQYGAVADGVADDTAALNAAAAAACALGDATLDLGAYTYATTGTVTFGCQVDGSQATINYSGADVAVLAGSDTPGATVARKKVHLPRVVCATRPVSGWDGTSVGVKLSNLNTCQITVPFVKDFEQGLLVYGKGAGCAYNTITLGALWENHKQLTLDSDAAGYTNQNTFLGGRLQQTLNRGAVNDDTAANQVLIGVTPGSVPNNNTFVGTSLEGDGPAYYRADINGWNNQFMNCRWENVGGESRVRFAANAIGNVIDGGYNADHLVATYIAGSNWNTIRDTQGYYLRAATATAQTVAADVDQGYVTILWAVTASRRVAYNTVTGEATPEPGRWRIKARVTVNSTTGGVIRARIRKGATDLDYDVKPPTVGDVTTLLITAAETFDGATPITVQVRADAANARTISTTAGFTRFELERA